MLLTHRLNCVRVTFLTGYILFGAYTLFYQLDLEYRWNVDHLVEKYHF
jgi:hypothetical protein